MREKRSCEGCGQPLPESAPEGLCPRCLMAGAMQPTEPASPAPLDTEAVRSAFPQFEVLSIIGQGGMGIVFKARQPQLDRFVALKILPPERTDDARFAERFQHEAQALARLSHPNIVTIHDFGKSGPFYFLLMEYVDGVNLRQLIRSRKLTPKEALAIVPPVCEALQYAHDRGIVHRDIKPENVLLDKEGKVKIADFGIAKILGHAPAIGLAETQPAGTPQYMAPEQRETPERADHRADIYSLGVVLYELLTGELPGKGLEPPSARVRGLQIDVRLDDLVLRALEHEPERRYQTAAQVGSEIRTIASTAVAGSAQGARAGTKLSSVSGTSAAAPGSFPAERRIPRTAIVGAVWAPLFFFALLPVFFVSTVSTGEPVGPAWWQILLASLILPVGGAAPFGTTILGWVAVTQIRRSGGRLTGLGLAVFDALFFPLIFLDLLIFCLTYVAMQLTSPLYGEPALEHVLAPAALLWIIADFWIVRWVWLAVCRVPGVPLTPEDRATRRTWNRTAVTASALLLVGAFFVATLTQRINARNIELMRALEQESLARQQRALEQPTTSEQKQNPPREASGKR